MKARSLFWLGAAAAAAALFSGVTVPAAWPGPGAEPVGRSGTNRLVTPVNQIVTPLGRQIELPGLRPQALALSPDGRLLAVAGKTSEVVLLDAATGAIRQRVGL